MLDMLQEFAEKGIVFCLLRGTSVNAAEGVGLWNIQIFLAFQSPGSKAGHIALFFRYIPDLAFELWAGCRCIIFIKHPGYCGDRNADLCSNIF